MPIRSRATVVVFAVVALAGAACGASEEVREVVAERNAASVAALSSSSGSNSSGLPEADVAGDGLAPGAAGTTPGTAGGVAAPSGPATASRPAGTRSAVGATAATGPTAGPAAAGRATGAPGGPSAAGAGPALPNPGPSPTPGPRGNGGATDVGVTAETIKVGGLFFNGSWLDKYSQVAEQAASAYFRYVNDRGGIHGRKIEFSGCDTAATVNGTQGCLRKLTEQDKVFSLGPSLDFNLDTAVPYLADKKVPFIGTPGLYDAEFDSPYMFSSQYRGGEMGAIAATFMVQRQGAKRIAVSWNTQPPGPPCFDGVKRVAKALGVEIVVDASNGPTESDLSPQVIRTRSANPDSIIFCNDPVNAVKFVQAAGRQNYEPPAGWIGAFCLADDVPQAMGPAGVGFFCLSSYDPYWGNSPGIVEMNQITRYYFPSHFHHAYTMPVFAGAKILVEALRRVGPELTRDKLLATMRTMDAFDTRMGITFNFASRVAQKASGIVAQADENLRWKLVTDRFAVAG